MRGFDAACAAAVVAGVVGGCATYTAPAGPERKLTGPQREFELTWDASLATLRTFGFEPSYEDRRSGVIRTDRTTSKTFLEPWRRDAITPGDILESSIQTIYRAVAVKVVPENDEKTSFKPLVEVHVSRSDRRPPQVTSSAEVYDMFTLSAHRRLAVRYGEEDAPAAVIVDLGRDEKLEAAIAEGIEAAEAKLRGGR
jgi:hypothetical protein